MVKFTTVLDTIDVLEYDGRKISLSTKEGNPIRFQMPRMYMPFGISGFTPAIGNTKWNIDFSLKGYGIFHSGVNTKIILFVLGFPKHLVIAFFN